MLLSSLIIIPVLAACVIMMMPADWKQAIKLTAATGGLLCLVISLYVFFSYSQETGGFQYVFQVPWIPQLGVTFFVGADGINLPMVVLAGFIMFTAILIAWNVNDRTKEFFTLFLILVSGVFGVFLSLDLFLLFIFYEIAVVPMYLLIGVWGSVRKEYAAMKLTLYLLVGSGMIFLGILALYFGSGLNTFDLILLSQVDFSRTFQIWVFPPHSWWQAPRAQNPCDSHWSNR